MQYTNEFCDKALNEKAKTNVEKITIMWTQMARSALVAQWTVHSHLCSILYCMLTYHDLFQREQVMYSAEVVTLRSHIPPKRKKKIPIKPNSCLIKKITQSSALKRNIVLSSFILYLQ